MSGLHAAQRCFAAGGFSYPIRQHDPELITERIATKHQSAAPPSQAFCGAELRGQVKIVAGLEHIDPANDPFILALKHGTRREALLVPAGISVAPQPRSLDQHATDTRAPDYAEALVR